MVDKSYLHKETQNEADQDYVKCITVIKLFNVYPQVFWKIKHLKMGQTDRQQGLAHKESRSESSHS